MPFQNKRKTLKKHSSNSNRQLTKKVDGIHLSQIIKGNDGFKENSTEINVTANVSEIDVEESDSEILSDVATNHSDSQTDLEDSFWYNEDETLGSSCSQDLDLIDLTVKYALLARENKEIKKELCSLRENLSENLSIIKELPSLMSSVTALFSEVKAARAEATILKEELEKARQTIKVMSPSEPLKSENQKISQEEVILIEDLSDDTLSAEEDTNTSDIHLDPTTPFLEFTGSCQQQMDISSTEVQSAVVTESFYHEDNSNANYVNFGGKIIPRYKIEQISHRKASILTTELCVLLFTPSEMALCSLSGKKSNAHRTSFPKKPLDPNRLKAIIDYVVQVFGMERNHAQQEVLKAIKVKLGNFLKTDEAKRIIIAYFESLGLRNPYQQPVTMNSIYSASLYAAANQLPHPVTQTSAKTTGSTQTLAKTTGSFSVTNQQTLPVAQNLVGNFAK